MQLVIAEKPGMAQSIARVIGADERKDGYMEGNDYLVSWCVGHLVELAAPDQYSPQYSRWVREDLPILPQLWQFRVSADTGKQFEILESLMKRPDVEELVEATDAGREGELIFRLVYQMAECSRPFKRLWISSMEEEAIRKGFEKLQPGEEYDHLYEAALCRAKADWLVGINATRLFTTLYQGKTLSVGRVMTPTLALLVEREQEIAGFKKEKFYTVELGLGEFKADSGRIRGKTEAEKLRKRCLGKPVMAERVERQEKRERPPLLFDLTGLQREANRIFGYTSQQTLDFLQLLYEKKLATYPRTDSRYLTEDMAPAVEPLCRAIAGAFPFAAGFSGQVDVSRVTDNARVSDHHAILPTLGAAQADLTALPTGERNILALVTARLLCAVCPEDYVCTVTMAVLICEGTEFTVRGREELSEGWKAMEMAFMASLKKRPEGDVGEEASAEKGEVVPKLSEGAVFTAKEADLREGITSPPVRYTEGSLLSAMERAGAEDMDDGVERKGLGTPATRAGIIEKLVKCGFIKRDKAVRGGAARLTPTQDGVALVGVLPDVVKSPELTAGWENSLALMARGEFSPEEFMAGIEDMVKELVQTCHSVSDEQKTMFGSSIQEVKRMECVGKCPKCGGDVVKGKFGAYCRNKCGMNVSRVMGAVLTDSQVKSMLDGKKTLVKGLKGKKGSYDAYLIPEGIENYSYTKDGKEIKGFQYKVKLEFPKWKK